MKTQIIPDSHPSAIQHAADVLCNGGLIAFPTDTVYGLAAPVTDVASIERLYVVKGRNNTKAIAVLFGEISDLDKIASQVNADILRLAEKFWPGPLTMILPRHPNLPDILAPLPTIGVRIPAHPTALGLLRLTGPLAVTSANLSGEENANTAQQVQQQLDGRVHLIIDGGHTPGGVASTVVDCTNSELKILREGPVTQEDIHSALA